MMVISLKYRETHNPSLVERVISNVSVQFHLDLLDYNVYNLIFEI